MDATKADDKSFRKEGAGRDESDKEVFPIEGGNNSSDRCGGFGHEDGVRRCLRTLRKSSERFEIYDFCYISALFPSGVFILLASEDPIPVKFDDYTDGSKEKAHINPCTIHKVIESCMAASEAIVQNDYQKPRE
jgi:hypothetical protein